MHIKILTLRLMYVFVQGCKFSGCKDCAGGMNVRFPTSSRGFCNLTHGTEADPIELPYTYRNPFDLPVPHDDRPEVRTEMPTCDMVVCFAGILEHTKSQYSQQPQDV